jgi:prevent-host-death family protein
MISVTIAEAKSRLAELIDQVNTGEEVVIMRRGHAIARLVPGVARSRLTTHSLTARGLPAQPSEPGDTLLGGLEDLEDTQPM